MIEDSCIKRSIFLRKQCMKEADERRVIKACKADTVKHISTVRSILYRTASQLRTSPIQGNRKVRYIERLKEKQGKLTLNELVEIVVYLKTHNKSKNLENVIKNNRACFEYDEYTETILINSINVLSRFKKVDNISEILEHLAREIEFRGDIHDYTKLLSPELEALAKVNHKVKDTVYDSNEYQKYIKVTLKKALEHHYSINSHHPEHYSDGVLGMNIIDVIEMMADWKASSLRYKDGDILIGIETNQKRFDYSDGFKLILRTTAKKFYRFQIEWVCLDGSKGYHRADTLEDIYKYISLNTPRIRKKDLSFLKETLLTGVKRIHLTGCISYNLQLQDYGDLSSYYKR